MVNNKFPARKDAMAEAIETIKAASTGITGIENLIAQAKGLAEQARSATTADRATLAAQYDQMLTQIDPPHAIVHASSSGGTQAGLVAGCRLHGLDTRVLGISADDASAVIEEEVRRILRDLEPLLGIDRSDQACEVGGELTTERAGIELGRVIGVPDEGI